MRKTKKKDSAVPYEFIQEVNKMSKDELVKRFIQEENDILALRKVKREDHQIGEIGERIKEHENGIKERIIALRKKIREIKDEDPEIVGLRGDKKDLEGGYRDELRRRKAYRDYLYEVMQTAFR